MTVYSSDGEVYDTPLHHELGMSQADLKPPEEGPIRVAGKKSYEPPPIKKPPTLPPLEPLTDPGNPPRGQYGPPGIEYPPWTVERPFAMNDNTPPLPLDITMPNIAGGLSKPPKPANDNDPRKPYGYSPGVDAISQQKDYDEIFRNIQSNPQIAPPEDFQRKGIPLPKTGDLKDVKPSTNIVKRSQFFPNESKETLYDATVARQRIADFGKDYEDTLGIGLKDVDRQRDLARGRSELRRLFKEQQMKKNIIEPSKRTEK